MIQLLNNIGLEDIFIVLEKNIFQEIKKKFSKHLYFQLKIVMTLHYIIILHQLRIVMLSILIMETIPILIQVHTFPIIIIILMGMLVMLP